MVNARLVHFSIRKFLLEKNCKRILNFSHNKMHANMARSEMPRCVQLTLKCIKNNDGWVEGCVRK